MLVSKFDQVKLKPHRSLRVLQAAEELIIEKGYSATSLNDIVKRAGCSKSTVYEFFGDKEGLLITLCQQLTSEIEIQLSIEIASPNEISHVLYEYARSALEKIISEKHIAFVCSILAESIASPQVAKAYYQAGPQRGIDQLANYLLAYRSVLVSSPDDSEINLDIEDAGTAARDFFNLIFGFLFSHLTLADPVPTSEELDNQARRIVDLFIRMYRVFP